MARDFYHELVKQALIDEGWTITHDPFPVSTGQKDLEVDLAAEKIIAATNGTEEIAIEVKSFLGRSTLAEFYTAFGQFMYYRAAFVAKGIERRLYLAVPLPIYESFLKGAFNLELLANEDIPLIVYYTDQPKIHSWT